MCNVTQISLRASLKWSESHLSPGVYLMYDLVHDSGILQSELFTSRSQNLVLPKLPNLGFWRYGQFSKWNKVKMAKNGLKMVEIFLGASHMIKNNISNFFVFSTFPLRYFTNPEFCQNFKKIAWKTRARKYPKTKNLKTKNFKILLFFICEAPKKISTIFRPF